MMDYPKEGRVVDIICDICETKFTEKVWKPVNKYSVSGCCPDCGSPMTSYIIQSSVTKVNLNE